MLPWVCSVIDHRRRQNVVKTSVTHSPAARVLLLCFYHILTSSVIYYWPDARQHGIYLLNGICVIPWFYIAHHLVRITLRLKRSTVVFTGRPKRGNKAPFWSPNAFNGDFDNSTLLKGVCLKTRHSGEKWSFEAETVPLLSFCTETKTMTPLFYLCFLLAMATQKICFKRKRNPDSRSFFFF